MRADHSCDDLQAIAERGYQRFGDAPVPTTRLGRLLHWLEVWRTTDSPRQLFFEWLDNFFELSARGTTPAKEVWTGCVSFMSMSYVMLVIPVLLYKVDSDLDFEALLTATNLSAAFASLLAGVLGNAPVGVMPGLRLNAYFAFGFCQTFKISWGEGLSCVFISGVLFLLLACLGVCNWIAREVLTDHLKKAMTVALGIFQAMIGFKMMGLIEPEADDWPYAQWPQQWWCRATVEDYVTLARLRNSDTFQLFIVGVFCLISGLLVGARVNGALLISMCLISVGTWMFGMFTPPEAAIAAPRFDNMFALDFSGWWDKEKFGHLVVGTSIMLFVSVFDVVGVQHGLYSIAGLLKFGSVPHGQGLVFSTAMGTIVGSLLGTGPLVIANESSAGILEGARTGLSAVVISMLFCFSAFITPLLKAMPDLAAAVPLVLIGAFMMEPSRSIAWDNLRVAIPCFISIVLIPHAIHNGIIVGIVVDVLLGLVVRWGSLMSTLFPTDEVEDGMGVAPDAPGGASAVASQSKPLATPHSWISSNVGLKDAEKISRVRELLHDLGPSGPSLQASETWEIALRRGLETYLDGMSLPTTPSAPSGTAARTTKGQPMHHPQRAGTALGVPLLGALPGMGAAQAGLAPGEQSGLLLGPHRSAAQ